MTISNTPVRPSEASASDNRQPYVITSALKTLRVLQAFTQPPHAFGLSEMVELVALDKNQVFRSLKTLEAAGMVYHDEDGQFRLAEAAIALGSVGSRQTTRSLTEIAQPFLDRLSSETQETVHLVVLSGLEGVCIDRRKSPHGIRLASAVGIRAPLHAGATTKAMLAFLPASQQEEVLARLRGLPVYTEKTTKRPEDLRNELARIRAQGYALSDEDFDASARGVGAPIFDIDGDVIAAISIGGPSFRIDDATVDRFASLVTAAAHEISGQYAYAGLS